MTPELREYIKAAYYTHPPVMKLLKERGRNTKEAFATLKELGFKVERGGREQP